MTVLRNSDREYLRHDFLCLRDEPSCYYLPEIREHNAHFFRLPCHYENIFKLPRAFRQVIQQHGPYEAVHCHCEWYNGVILKHVAKCGVPVRIAHTHVNRGNAEPIRKRLDPARLLRISRRKRLIRKYATHSIACSEGAGKAIWGDSWGKDPRRQTLYCGIDLKPFSAAVDKTEVRQELEIPQDALVVGHVGRFGIEKNHTFMIDILSELVRLESKAILLLVGGGNEELQKNLCRKIDHLGLKDRVIFTGFRADIPRLLQGAMDCLLFPSLHEGLGLVGVEAQAAGIPCVMSDHIPLATEGNVVPGLIYPVPLAAPAIDWARQIQKLQNRASLPAPSDALDLVLQSKFNIDTSLNLMIRLWANETVQ